VTEDVAEDGGSTEDSGFSPKEIAQFALRAVRDNVAICILIAVVVSAIGVTVVSALPRIYDSTCKIFVQEAGAVTTNIASGTNHYSPGAAMRGLQEFILTRDNLMSIVREAKLAEKWPRTRPWPMQIKDKIFRAVFGPVDPKYLERGFADMLGGMINAAKEGESIRITAAWRDPQSAYEITRLVQRNFLAARASNDLGPVRRVIPFLEEQQLEADQAIEEAIARVVNAKAQNPSPAPAAAQAQAQAGGAAKPAPKTSSSMELATLSRELAENRKEQRALMEPRRQRIAALKLELLDMSAGYSEEHPLVQQREARIASLSEVPQEVVLLRQKESQLLNALASRGVVRTATEVATVAERLPDPNDPELLPLQMQLGAALRKSDDVAARLQQVQIELATAEADFKHRYVVVEEAEVPNRPIKPKAVPLLYLLCVVAGLVLGAATGVLLELRRGRLVDLWQVRALGIELLGEVNLK
jgi:hypothetical protein